MGGTSLEVGKGGGMLLCQGGDEEKVRWLIHPGEGGIRSLGRCGVIGRLVLIEMRIGKGLADRWEGWRERLEVTVTAEEGKLSCWGGLDTVW